jgi:hypothetical protein
MAYVVRLFANCLESGLRSAIDDGDNLVREEHVEAALESLQQGGARWDNYLFLKRIKYSNSQIEPKRHAA